MMMNTLNQLVKKFVIPLATLSLFCSCGPQYFAKSSSNTPNYSDSPEEHSAIKEYIETVKVMLARNNIPVDQIDNQSFHFVDNLDPNNRNVVARCYTGHNLILIDRSKWAELSYNARLEMVIHELGHCVWGLPHSSDFNSIMFPLIHYFDSSPYHTTILESMIPAFARLINKT